MHYWPLSDVVSLPRFVFRESSSTGIFVPVDKATGIATVDHGSSVPVTNDDIQETVFPDVHAYSRNRSVEVLILQILVLWVLVLREVRVLVLRVRGHQIRFPLYGILC